MADKRDYYEVLGVDKGADEDTIKKAYRKKAKQYHPDLHPGDAEAEKNFKEVNEAYAVLSDSDKRSKYDRFGHAGVDPNMGGGSGFEGFGFDMDLGDIFGSIFGGGSRGRRRANNGPVRGDDLRYDATITFEEAIFGAKKDISYARIENCPDCGGSGAEKGTKPETCPVCSGTGTVRSTQRTMLGMMSTESPCTNCHGTGKVIKKPCGNCKGKGLIRIKKSLTVDIPAGIDDGQRLRLAGQGNDGKNGGSAGDLYLYISVKPHRFFKRDMYDLYCTIPITIVEATLGGEIQVPTPEGETIGYKIPEGTQTGSLFKINGRGVVKPGGTNKGNLFFYVEVETPKSLSKKQKDLLKELQSTMSGKNNSKKTKFYDNLK